MIRLMNSHSSARRVARQTLCRRLIVLLGALWAQVAIGDSWNDSLQVHGFVTQGFVHTTDNRFFGDSENGSFDFTELGVNLSYRATPCFSAAQRLFINPQLVSLLQPIARILPWSISLPKAFNVSS